MKSAVHIALLIATIYEYFFTKEEENKDKQQNQSYENPDLETVQNGLILTDTGRKRYNSMKETTGGSYPYKFDESDEEEEQKQAPLTNDDGFQKQEA